MHENLSGASGWIREERPDGSFFSSLLTEDADFTQNLQQIYRGAGGTILSYQKQEVDPLTHSRRSILRVQDPITQMIRETIDLEYLLPDASVKNIIVRAKDNRVSEASIIYAPAENTVIEECGITYSADRTWSSVHINYRSENSEEQFITFQKDRFYPEVLHYKKGRQKFDIVDEEWHMLVSEEIRLRPNYACCLDIHEGNVELYLYGDTSDNDVELFFSENIEVAELFALLKQDKPLKGVARDDE